MKPFVEPTIKFVFRAVVQDSDLLDNAITATSAFSYALLGSLRAIQVNLDDCRV
jgi:hypothetical protein